MGNYFSTNPITLPCYIDLREYPTKDTQRDYLNRRLKIFKPTSASVETLLLELERSPPDAARAHLIIQADTMVSGVSLREIYFETREQLPHSAYPRTSFFIDIAKYKTPYQRLRRIEAKFPLNTPYDKVLHVASDLNKSIGDSSEGFYLVSLPS